MRQAGWGDIFVERNEPLVLTEVPQEPRGWRRLLWWEDWVTFVLLGAMVLTVVVSVQQANWVDTMPSLYPIAFFGLLVGTLLARVRWPEPIIHILALPIGAAAALGIVLSNLPGASPVERYWELHHRMADWFHIAFYGGISNDDLPFIVLVVPLVWLSGYLSGWAVFRWNNAWAAVIPGGAVLLANMSFLPGGFSTAFVMFVLLAALLVTRLNVIERARTWREEQTPYPAMLSLSVMHATFWLALILLGAAWLLPSAGETSKLESTWDGATQPLVQRVEGVSRLFVGVNNKKSVRVHDFDDILPLLGSISLPEAKVADIKLDQPLAGPLFLKGATYDVYTSQGWMLSENPSVMERLAAGETIDPEVLSQLREVVSAEIELRRNSNEGLLSPGQPLSFDRRVRIDSGSASGAAADSVRRVLPNESATSGDTYNAQGTVSVATEDELRRAGESYPDWVEDAYLELPEKLPLRINNLATKVTVDAESPYDEAIAIEQHLRKNYNFTLNVPEVPTGRDAVDYFLFDSKRGYFDYHASAMVVMLRTLGVPSRLSVGYVLQGADYDAETNRYRVTEASAFAWPEVYFPGYGWLEFNPTPDYAPISRAGAAPVADGSAPDVPEFPGFGLPNAPEQQVDAPLPVAEAPDSEMNRTAWVLIGLGIGVIVLLVGGGTSAHYFWTRGLSDLEPPARLWGQTVRLASWAGLPPASGQTPREYANTLSTRIKDLEGADVLAEGFVRHRYGAEPADTSLTARLEDAWRSVRGRLLTRLVRRA